MTNDTVRCKFLCVSKREYKSGADTLWDYTFNAVYGNSEENKVFWKFTPSGTLNVSCTQVDRFHVGTEYFLDIFPAGSN